MWLKEDNEGLGDIVTTRGTLAAQA